MDDKIKKHNLVQYCLVNVQLMQSLWSLNVYALFIDGMKQLMMFILRSKYLFLLRSIYVIYMFIYSSRQYFIANDVELKAFTDKHRNVAELEWFQCVRWMYLTLQRYILIAVSIWRWLKELFVLRSLLHVCELMYRKERKLKYMHVCTNTYICIFTCMSATKLVRQLTTP